MVLQVHARSPGCSWRSLLPQSASALKLRILFCVGVPICRWLVVYKFCCTSNRGHITVFTPACSEVQHLKLLSGL